MNKCRKKSGKSEADTLYKSKDIPESAFRQKAFPARAKSGTGLVQQVVDHS